MGEKVSWFFFFGFGVFFLVKDHYVLKRNLCTDYRGALQNVSPTQFTAFHEES